MSAKKRAKTAISIGLSVGIVLALVSVVGGISHGGEEALLVVPYAILCVIMAPTYTFGYAFANWEKIIDNTGKNVKSAFSGFFSARKLDKLNRGRTNYTLWAWVLGILLVAWNLGMGWIPGIFRGIKALQEEKAAEAKKGFSKPAAPSKPTFRKVPTLNVKMPKLSPAAEAKLAPSVAEPKVVEPVVEPKPAVKKTTPKNENPQPKSMVAPAVQPKIHSVPITPLKPVLRCTGGLFNGADFDVEAGEELLIGSDPSMCQIVLPKEIASPLHCSMYFDKDSNYWFVRDLTDGKTLENGARSLKTGVFKLVKPGTTLSIGDGMDVQKFELA